MLTQLTTWLNMHKQGDVSKIPAGLAFIRSISMLKNDTVILICFKKTYRSAQIFNISNKTNEMASSGAKVRIGRYCFPFADTRHLLIDEL